MAGRIDPCVLWSRAALVGAIAFFLGVAGHVTADGLLPGPWLLAGLLWFSVLAGVPLLNRRAGPVRLVSMLVGGQAAIHLALTVTAGHAGDTATAASGPGRGTALGALPVTDGHRVGSLQDAYQGVTGPPPMTPALPVGHLVEDLSAHAPMMAAHLAAAALLGLWLAHGERCLWTLLALTGRRVLAAVLLLVPAPLPPQSRWRYAVVATLTGPRSRWLVRPDSRRGPPVLAA
jgi:hypothetical protein